LTEGARDLKLSAQHYYFDITF